MILLCVRKNVYLWPSLVGSESYHDDSNNFSFPSSNFGRVYRNVLTDVRSLIKRLNPSNRTRRVHCTPCGKVRYSLAKQFRPPPVLDLKIGKFQSGSTENVESLHEINDFVTFTRIRIKTSVGITLLK